MATKRVYDVSNDKFIEVEVDERLTEAYARVDLMASAERVLDHIKTRRIEGLNWGTERSGKSWAMVEGGEANTISARLLDAEQRAAEGASGWSKFTTLLAPQGVAGLVALTRDGVSVRVIRDEYVRDGRLVPTVRIDLAGE